MKTPTKAAGTTTRTDQALPQGWTGVVLAGGQSTRMGQDKALLPWRGRPLLEHMTALLAAAGAARVVVSGHHPRYQGIVDPCPQRGPLGGLHGVAQALGDGPLLVVPVDMPGLTVGLLQRLVQCGPARCVILARHRLPMRWDLDDAGRTLLRNWMQDPSAPTSLRAFQQALGVRELPIGEGDLPKLANCNTPSEWEALAP